MNEENRGIDNILRYGWTIKDSCEGILMRVSKHNIKIPHEYQRPHKTSKINEIAKNWSWIAFGVLIIAAREDRGLYVIDGQHRLMAGLRRSDITELPCIIFEVESVSKEASGFIQVNTNRKPLDSFSRYKASIESGDTNYVDLHNVLNKYNVIDGPTSRNRNTIACLSTCIRIIKTYDVDSFTHTFDLAYNCSKINEPITSLLLEGLHYLLENLKSDIVAFKKRVIQVGNTSLSEGARRAALYNGNGGYKVWANGMLEVINKALRNKFYI